MIFPALARHCLTELRRPWVLGNSGALARFARNPVPFRAPWRSEILHVHRNMGLGDVLLCTPALREVKRLNPKCFIRFYTGNAAVVRGLPYIDEVLPFGDRPPGSISIVYEDAIPPRSHLARIMGDVLGVRVEDVRPDCVVRPEEVEAFRTSWAHLPRPHIAVLRRAGRHTPNKDWPDYSWIALIGRLVQFGSVIEIGEAGDAPRTAVGKLRRSARPHFSGTIGGRDGGGRSACRSRFGADAHRRRGGNALGRDLWRLHRPGEYALSRQRRDDGAGPLLAVLAAQPLSVRAAMPERHFTRKR